MEIDAQGGREWEKVETNLVLSFELLLGFFSIY
jgi:hypothetical protein